MSHVKPLVLLVEDQEQERRSRADFLRDVGFTTIAVGSAAEAEGELRGAPGVDLVVTDINLDPHSSRDKSGVLLAKRTNALFPRLPVVAYSARFEKDDLPADDRKVFRDSIIKGNLRPKELIDKFEEWFKIAVEHHQYRREFVTQELHRLIRKYSISEYDFELIREFIPVADGLTRLSEKTPESVLAEAGFTLRIIGAPEAKQLLKPKEQKLNINVPVAVWIRAGENHFLAEVLRFPSLYASGATSEDALAQLLRLMHGYYYDLRNATDDQLSPAVRSLRDFLNAVFY